MKDSATPKTLCAHIEEELHIINPQAYMKLVQPATHYCKGCGRCAVKPANLCKPEKLE
jgi:Pyruvate/2-oxoacid:ferredoxin oxidoreductase delta subunit